ncbi:MAG: phospholipase D-like domain-containing protein [Eubacterium sp.]
MYLTTPYLIISDEMQRALVLAAGRGVDVRIITPGVPDKAIVYRITRSNYHDLLKGGVRIFEYVPGFIHAKNFVSDDEIAVVGTVNMDFRSLYLHFECGAVLYQTGTVADVKADFEETLFSAREVYPEDMRRGFFSGILDALLRLLSPLV